MKVFRIYDKEKKEFIKIGKRTNDIYVNKPAVIATLIKYYNLENYNDRFDLIDYELVRIKKEERD